MLKKGEEYQDSIKKQIERLRRELYDLIHNHDVDDEVVIKKSQELD